MAYQRIRQPKLSDVIEQELERLIVEGTLSAGQQLPPERELAKQFDVSRPSIREAIQRLEAQAGLAHVKTLASCGPRAQKRTRPASIMLAFDATLDALQSQQASA